MEFALSAEQRDLGDSERAWLSRNDPISRWRDNDIDRTAVVSELSRQHLVEAGLASLLTKEVGATHVDLLVLVEEHGRAGSDLPLAESALAAHHLETVSATSSDPVAAGEIGAVTTVPGEDPLLVTMGEEGLCVRGRTALVSGADGADEIVLVAPTAQGTDVVAVLERDDVMVTPVETLDLLRPWAWVDLDVVLPRTSWHHAPVGTAVLCDQQLAVYRAVDAVGCADRLLAMTVEYAGQRQQFGKPIGSFQAVKHHIASMALAVESARSVLWAAAVALDEEMDPAQRTRAVSSGVAYATRAASDVGQTALQVHGGIGFTWEHDVHAFIRRITVDALLTGGIGEHRRRVVETFATA